MTIVISKVFGQGTVISEENGNVTVDFNGIIKTLVVAFARLTNEDGSIYGQQFIVPEKKQMSSKKRSEKLQITSKGSFDSMFTSVEDRENWKEKREQIRRNTISY
jgi:hypothetical protein